MKKLVVIILLIGSISVFSQEAVTSKEEVVTFENEIKEKGGKLPQYPGGIDVYRKNFSQTFDGSKINGKGMIKSEAQFVISEEGTITNILISGDNKSMNKEMERAVKAMAKTKWKPAELNGQPVKYRFRFPITMQFE